MDSLLSEAQIEKIGAEALAAIASASDVENLKEIKISHVGDKSPIAKANQSLGKMDPADKAKFGKVITV